MMGLLQREIEIEIVNNAKHYEDKGYYIPREKDKWGRKTIKKGTNIKVKLNDLPKNSKIKVDIECDGGCGKVLSVTWESYSRYSKEDGKYYCQKCSKELYSSENARKTRLNNGKSFEQWCIENDKRDVLDRWDYELNKYKPNEVGYGSTLKCYFKCPNGIHNSEEKLINSFTSGQDGSIKCIACNSFEQWCIENNRQDILDRWDYDLNDCKPCEIGIGVQRKFWFKCDKNIHPSELKYINHLTYEYKFNLECNQCNSIAQYLLDEYGENALDLYWDYDKNIHNPWFVNKGSSKLKIWVKCQNKDYHESYSTSPNNFVSQRERCPYCCNNQGRVHKLDSLGSLNDKSVYVWSDKNKKTVYQFSPYSNQKVWWKCEEGMHEDYKRSVNNSNRCDFRCPECQFSRGEVKINEFLINNKIRCETQKEFDKLTGLGNRNLTYDFYLPKYNLLIEYQGEQHEKPIDFKGRGEKYAKEQFEKQKEHDKRKREYAKENNIKLLEIWYWDFDNIEKILDKELYLK